MNSRPVAVETDIQELHKTIAHLKEQLNQHQISLEQLQHRADIQTALNDILHISLLPVTLEEQLNRILRLVLEIPWLSLEEMGCVFLQGKSGEHYDMVAHHNLSDSLLNTCRRVAPGQCLCGKAAQTQELLFKHCIDHDHHNRPEGMTPHGHYIMPIVSKGETLGILNLYVKHGHRQDPLEVEFLEACGNIMAGIIERKMIERELHRLSYTDELTGAANRRSFMQKLALSASHSKQADRIMAILFLDLDYFKEVNDAFGHEYGDQLLIMVSRRIQNCVRNSDTVARMGGDEFAVLLEMIKTPQQAVAVADGIVTSVAKPYRVKDEELRIGVSVGISLYPTHGTDIEDLLKMADVALYRAKERRGRATLYNQANLQTN